MRRRGLKVVAAQPTDVSRHVRTIETYAANGVRMASGLSRLSLRAPSSGYIIKIIRSGRLMNTAAMSATAGDATTASATPKRDANMREAVLVVVAPREAVPTPTPAGPRAFSTAPRLHALRAMRVWAMLATPSDGKADWSHSLARPSRHATRRHHARPVRGQRDHGHRDGLGERSLRRDRARSGLRHYRPGTDQVLGQTG
jgi:hypothetical protein